MASDAAAPNVSNAIRFEENGCIAPGGLAAARPGKGQGYFRTSFIRLTSLSRGFGSIGGPPEHRTVHPHAMHDNGQFSGDGNLRLLQAVSFGEPKAPRLERGPFLDARQQRASELLAECACFDLRNATRAVSRMYEDFLRDEGLNGTQFSLLSLIRAGKELSISTLGRAMALDRTSITRALAPLERDGLIRSRPGADKRIRIVSLTNKGRKLVEDAEPKWRQAQEALMQTIGEDRWRAMRTLLRDTTRMVRHRTITAE
jgi:DNA-binding MarR family transcriptional regulator